MLQNISISLSFKLYQMRQTLSLKHIVPIHESFFLSNHDKVECSCRCKLTITSSNSSCASNNESQIHHLCLERNESRALCWMVRHIESSNIEFDIDDTNEETAIHLTIYPDDGCCDCQATAFLPSSSSLNEGKVKWVDLKSNGVVMAKLYLSIDKCYTRNNFTSNDESDLHLTIRLNQVHFHEIRSIHGPVVITYEFTGAMIKSNEFDPKTKEFEPVEDEFHISINHDEMKSFLEQNKIVMYVYNDGMIFGEVKFDLYSALILGKVENPCGSLKLDQRWKRWIELCSPAETESANTWSTKSSDVVMKVQVELIISKGNPTCNDKGDQDTKYIFVTKENSSNIQDGVFLTKNGLSSSSKSISEQSLMEKANSLARAELELDKRTQKWDEFRISEERKFQDYLMKKEEALRCLLQEHMKEQEIDHMRTIETCRSEYKRLEARLKSALSEIETKEREMDRILAANNTTFIQKVTELELKYKLIQDEAKHTVDMEVSEMFSNWKKIA